MKIRILIMFFLSIFASLILFSKVDLKQKILLEQNENSFIQLSRSFFVKNNKIFIIDAKASNIKIFNMDGSFNSIFGKRGAGPDEFIYPTLCDSNDQQLIVLDMKLYHFLIFDNIGSHNFKYRKKNLSLFIPNEFKILNKDLLLIAGHTRGKEVFSKSHHFYILDLNKNTKSHILPSYIAFGCKSTKDYRYRFNSEFKYVGRNGFCDFDSKYYYFILESNLNVIRIDRKTREIFTFGYTTRNFIRPTISKRLKKSFGKKIKIYWEEIKKFSHIRKIFVSRLNMIGVIYSSWKNNKINLFLQLYSQNGILKSDELLLNCSSDSFYDIGSYYDKVENLVYILDNEPTEDDDILHKIYTFKI